MKKIICVLILMIIVLVGCNGKKEQNEQNKQIESAGSNNATKTESLEDIPDNFSLVDARNSNMIIVSNGAITSRRDIWEAFLTNTRKGTTDKIFIANYYEIGNENQYDPAYLEEIKDDYPVMYISCLEYKDDKFTISHYENKEYYTYTYKYMIERIGQINENAAIATHGFYLVNDRSLTLHELEWSVLSSQSTDHVDYQSVIVESINKAEYKGFKPGTYSTEDGSARIDLHEDCTFVFNRHIATSYDPSGHYSYKDGKLVLYVSEKEEYIFKAREGGGFVFESDKDIDAIVKVGTVFLESDN